VDASIGRRSQMTKRTAMLMAAGVVAALFAGSVALAFGLSGTTAATADTPAKLDPIVRTVHRTVRVEKEAKPADQPVQVVTLGSDPAPAETVSTDDDAFEDADDAFEDEDHEDDGSEDHDDDGSEDHEDDGSEDHDDDGFEDD
jgi:ABC-type glycerol-3-phosphate transport system substrate-binding protein